MNVETKISFSEGPLRRQQDRMRWERVRIMLVLGHPLGPNDARHPYMEQRLGMVVRRHAEFWNKIILCGGMTNSGQTISEAESMYQWIRGNKKLSSLADILHAEGDSCDMAGNIRSALDFLRTEYKNIRQGKVIEIFVVTHSWHMARAMAVCHKVAGKHSKFQFNPHPVITGNFPSTPLVLVEGLKALYSKVDPELKVRRIIPLRSFG